MMVILMVADQFSKAISLIALPKLPTDSEMASLLVKHVFWIHGNTLDVVSDRGPQFSSQVCQAFCKALGATASLSSGFHPQTNRQEKHSNQDLEATLPCIIAGRQHTWSSPLVWVEYAHNTLVSSATGLSPFEVSLGYQLPLFPEQEVELAVSVLPVCCVYIIIFQLWPDVMVMERDCGLPNSPELPNEEANGSCGLFTSAPAWHRQKSACSIYEAGLSVAGLWFISEFTPDHNVRWNCTFADRLSLLNYC